MVKMLKEPNPRVLNFLIPAVSENPLPLLANLQTMVPVSYAIIVTMPSVVYSRFSYISTSRRRLPCFVSHRRLPISDVSRSSFRSAAPLCRCGFAGCQPDQFSCLRPFPAAGVPVDG